MEYELMMETINPCGGDRHAIREFLEVETDDPEAYVREQGRFPIVDVTLAGNGDLVIVTGDGKGYVIRYTFTA